MMTNETKARILDYFDELLPDAACELNYQKPHELLIAVMLSAQTTDVSVNKATPFLFAQYPTVASLARADVTLVEQAIHSIGLYKTKAKNIILAAQKLMSDFQGQVPMDKDALLTLPGVGVKSANVVRAELFHIPEIPVDTHVARIAKRLGFAGINDDVTAIERKLRRQIPVERYISFHHQMIHFGRYHCPARRMTCYRCPLKDICKEKNKNLTSKE